MQERAVEAGFDAAGVAAVMGQARESEQLDAERFEAWVDAGRAGEMEYLKRRNDQGVLLRKGVQVAVPWARSVIVCVLNYNSPAPLSIDAADSDRGWIARYAWSGKPSVTESNELLATDYHDELLGRLRAVEKMIQERHSCETRCYVDTGPLVERSAAAKAGVGWIGKNTCVLNQQLGSWLLLGVIVTSIPVSTGNPIHLAADRCGSCTRCIDACPTGALVSAREMDASRCIAYLTIEKKGAIDEELRGQMGRQVFGCDICQEVCPWNRRAPAGVQERMQARKELINPALEWLAGMDAAEFKRWFNGSPLERTRRKRLLRNVAIAMGNSGEEKFLPQLQAWSKGEEDVLAQTAAWAANQIQDHIRRREQQDNRRE